jgi:membrane protein implicated in regulation of membrane protease activity
MDMLFGGLAPWFVFPALIGTGYLLIQMLLGQIGGEMDIDVDREVGGDSESGHEVTLISIQSMSAFLMGYGWMGFSALRFLEMGFFVSAVIGVASGIGVAYLMVRLLRMLMRIQSDANVSIDSAVGLTGSVYARVPERGAGRGEVVLVIHGSEHRFRAVQEGDEGIERHSSVRVVRANREDNTIVVEHAG